MMLLASVSERTREIVIRRAVGATQIDIVIQFLAETILLTFFGGLFGVFFGIVLVYLISSIASWAMIINP